MEALGHFADHCASCHANDGSGNTGVGRNLYLLRPAESGGKVTPLTSFEDGFVSDCEVSWDGKKIIFARRLNGEERNYQQVRYRKARLREPGELLLGGPDDPWWHIWEMNADGTGQRALTDHVLAAANQQMPSPLRPDHVDRTEVA